MQIHGMMQHWRLVNVQLWYPRATVGEYDEVDWEFIVLSECKIFEGAIGKPYHKYPDHKIVISVHCHSGTSRK